MGIHPTAMVHPNARCGRVTIDAYAVVGKHVVLRDGVRVGAHAVITGSTVVGDHTIIHPHVCLGGSPQDREHDGSTTALHIGKHCVFREFSTAHCGSSSGSGVTMVGDHAMVMVGSHIAHDCSLGFGVTLANGVVLGGHSQVADGVVFGGVSAVHQHVRIGRLAMVAGGAMCAQDVLPLCLVRGDRARMVGLNRVGLSRAGYDLPQLSKLTRLWKRLFASGQPLPMALASLDAVERSLPEVAAWLTFIEHSTRGICRYEAQAG